MSCGGCGGGTVFCNFCGVPLEYRELELLRIQGPGATPCCARCHAVAVAYSEDPDERPYIWDLEG